MNPYDQSVYDAGFKYIPQSRFLLKPFQIPQDGGGGATGPVQPGLPSINMGGGGGGGAAYTGGITGLTTDFQKAIDARQNRLNNPPDKFFGFDTMRDQQLTGADAGFYDTIPQERTLAGNIQNFLTPQSANQIIEEGYTPKANIGILSNILGKFDKFGTLPRGDQAFIASQMGYTGPTVFGDNQSGLSKDPFGLNVRSAFGNYAERVGVEVDKLSSALGADGAIGGKKDFQGAVFDPTTNSFVAAEDSDLTPEQIAALNKRTQLVRKKLTFYRKKVKERDDARQAALDRQIAEQGRANLLASKKLTDEQRAQEERNINRVDRAYREETGGQAGSYGPGGDSGRQFDSSGAEVGYNDPFDPGGGEKDGGFIDGTNRRIDFMMGGLADLVDIYD